MMVMVIVASALYNKMRESARKRKRKKKREERERKSMCMSACSSSDVNAFTLPFFLLDYAMRKDKAHATDNEGKRRV
jgi:hypothetical protein